MRRLYIFALVSAPLLAQQPCENLIKLALPDVTITSAMEVPAGRLDIPGGRGQAATATVPAFCRVAGFVRPEVKFEVWLPAKWNRKFLMVGNGGLAGTISFSAMVDPLDRGYATSSTDTGHTADSDGHWAQGHMDRVIDYAHRSIHVTAEASKAVIRAFYGAPPQHSYFDGCSKGGQQALSEVQRYPADFDGVIAGDPANYTTHLMIGAHLWITEALLAEPGSYIPASKTKLIGDAVYGACDALDGIKDGILNDPRKCHFDPGALQCKGADAPDCLTAPQVEALKKIYQGARSSDGHQIFPGLLPGGEAGQGGWSTWISGAAAGRGAHMTLGIPFLSYIAFGDPKWDFRSFRFDRTQDFDSDVDELDATLGPIFDDIDPNLKAFQSRGGKLIQYHGFSDPDISPLNSINYYQSVEKQMGDPRAFYRLFMVPGMFHCSGGPGPNTFDVVAALEQWVEQGKAPAQMTASHATSGKVDRTRPLCPFPQEAKWKGKGSTDQAENFVCATPKP